jgi:hypothetical protein
MAGQYLRGALIEFTESFPIPLPNVILFQYNPETMTHTWTPAKTGGVSAPGQSPSNPLAITGTAGGVVLFHGDHGCGRYDCRWQRHYRGTGGDQRRLSDALRRSRCCCFPLRRRGADSSVLFRPRLGLGGSTPPATSVPSAQLPTVLFVWGPGRIAAVRVTALTITEKLFDGTLLVPTHAEAQLGLKVLTQPELQYVDGPLGILATGAATYMTGLREALAIANLANSVESIIGMLPV